MDFADRKSCGVQVQVACQELPGMDASQSRSRSVFRTFDCVPFFFLACHPRKVAHTVDAREEREKGDDEMVEELFFSFNRRTEGGTEGCDVASP